MKYKSYAFWTSLSAAVVVLVGLIANAFGFEADEKLVSDIIMAICGVLVVLGVVQMPLKDSTSTDDESQEDDESSTEDENSTDKTDDKTK